jgi:hypothetical protein
VAARRADGPAGTARDEVAKLCGNNNGDVVPSGENGVEAACAARAAASADERQQRKRRLLKGSQEFRDVRRDLPKPKS